jgi:hypothetical protein
MTTTKLIPLRDADDRAARFLAIAHVLDVEPGLAYVIADDALDVDRFDDPIRDTLLLLAQASFRGDDDYDDFRTELRRIVWGPDAD